MGAALALGAIAGGASAESTTELEHAGSVIGLAFQVQDDLLNAKSSLERLGKRAGTDRARGKATFPAVAGEVESRAAIPAFLARARLQILANCPRPDGLLRIVDAIAGRTR